MLGLLFGVRSTPVLPQWHVKDHSHSAKSADGKLHLNTHTPLTQQSGNGLTMPLSSHSVGTYPETSSHATCQGTLGHSRLSSLSHYGLSSQLISSIPEPPARVVGHHKCFHNQIPPFFPCSPLPSGTWRTPGLYIPASSFVCLVFFPLSLYLSRWFWPDLMNGRHIHTTAVCVSLQWSGDFRVVRLPAKSWHGLPRW